MKKWTQNILASLRKELAESSTDFQPTFSSPKQHAQQVIAILVDCQKFNRYFYQRSHANFIKIHISIPSNIPSIPLYT